MQNAHGRRGGIIKLPIVKSPEKCPQETGSCKEAKADEEENDAHCVTDLYEGKGAVRSLVSKWNMSCFRMIEIRPIASNGQSAFFAGDTSFTFQDLRMTDIALDTLQKEKQKFEALFHYATIGIVISDSKGDIALVNAHAEHIFGYDQLELVGKKVEILLSEAVRGRHVDHRKSYTVHPEVRPMGIGRDLTARRKDGSEFPVEVSLSYFHSDDGLFVIAFLQDITLRRVKDETLRNQKEELEKIAAEIKMLNANLELEVEKRTEDLQNTLEKLEASGQELQKALERERQLGELKSRFVTMASHEFKTPLSTILTSATLISKYKSDKEQEQRDKHLKRISDSVQNLTNLLNEFLSLGKLDEGRVGLKIESLSVVALVADVVLEMENHVKTGQKIVVVEPKIDRACELDKGILHNILVNLISNAIKFSSENSIVNILIEFVDKELIIKISDEGIGIPEEDRPHLFSRFFRARNVENVKGTGLGLHIVQRYVEMMNGKILCKSALGKGTTFTLAFPQK